MYKPVMRWFGFPVLAALLGAGCLPSLQNNLPREPIRQVPESFATDPNAVMTDLGAGLTPRTAKAASVAHETFAQFFSQPEIKELLDTAVSHNQELNMELQEIMIAQNEVSARQGEYWPRLGAQVGAGIEKVGDWTSQGKSDIANNVPANLGDFSFGLVASWEVDIWRKLRDARDAADLRYMASIEARNFLVTQIVAEVVRSYYELLAIDSMLAILRRNIDLQTNALYIVALEKQAARVTELAVQRFEAEVLKNKGRLFELQQERVQTENRINFLVGRFPQPLSPDLVRFDDTIPDVIEAGLPSELLDNRPDVRQAEMALAATKLDVGVARASFYPSLSIEAGVGYRAFNIAHLVATPASLLYNLAGHLMAPLLNRNAIAAEYQSANSRQIQAVFQYEKTLLQAFTDVANQLAMIENLGQVYKLRSQQVATLERSVDISTTLFQSARADYMEVLLTRRDFLDAQMELVETKRQRFTAVITLYQALGGGWRVQ